MVSFKDFPTDYPPSYLHDLLSESPYRILLPSFYSSNSAQAIHADPEVSTKIANLNVKCKHSLSRQAVERGDPRYRRVYGRFCRSTAGKSDR